MDVSCLPDTPAGRGLGKYLTAASSESPPSPHDVEALFSNSCLATDRAEALLASLMQLRLRLRGASIVRASARGPLAATAVMTPTHGWPFTVTGKVANTQPHALVDVSLGIAGEPDPTLPSWADLLAAEPEPRSHSSLDPDLTAHLDELVIKHRHDEQLPGLIAAMADARGRLQWSCAVGASELAPIRQPTVETAVRIGSISKTVTALAVVQLVERGLVDLDRPTSAYLTSYEVCGPDGEDITVRQLLNHTSGLREKAGHCGYVVAGRPMPSAVEQHGPRLLGTDPPGSRWDYAYSGVAYDAAGQVVEDMSGMPFSRYAVEHIFDRLGMRHTSFVRDNRVGDVFRGLEVESDRLHSLPYLEIIGRAGGSVYSTVHDMALYGAAILGDGANSFGRVLRPASMGLLFEPQDLGPVYAADDLDGFVPTMGLGWNTLSRPGEQIRFHTGGWPGAASEFVVLPTRGRTIMLFANRLTAGVGRLTRSLVQIATTLPPAPVGVSAAEAALAGERA